MRLTRICYLLFLLTPLAAQPDRLPQTIDDTRTVVLTGHRTRLAAAANDAGPADPNLAMGEISLQFKPTAAQQQDLDQFLADVQNRASPLFHHWLKPEEFADRFSLSASDYAKAAAWLSARGFKLAPAARGRAWILFEGNASQVQSAFGAEVHSYRIQGGTPGQMHYSISTDPRLPADLAAVTGFIGGLDDFLPTSESHLIDPKQTSASGSYTLAPDDVAAIYNISPLFQAGFDGAGQSIAVTGQSRPGVSDMTSFRTAYNLPTQRVRTMLAAGATDPGVTPDLQEADLDVQWSGAVARNATIYYVYASNFYTALQYSVDENLAPVVTASYSFLCEALNFTRMAGFRLTAQQANAQGITWVNASGDAGAAGCDLNGSLAAQNGLAVRTPANVPEVTAVGGTEFNEGSGSYWSAANTSNMASVVGYIPETVWNDSAALNFLAAGGGGVSVFFPRPSWQTGAGVPSGNYRLLPDVSFSAAAHDPYNVVYNGNVVSMFGTSASAPLFAGMLAVLNQSLGANGLGNVNPALYSLANSAPAAFHDVITGDNKVPCIGGSPDCASGTFGYSAGSGYDVTTGLGSVDLSALANAWKGLAAPKQALVTASFSNTTLYQHAPDSSGATWSLTITLKEEAGVAATLSSFTLNGTPVSLTLFSSTSIPPNGSITAAIGFQNVAAPIAAPLALAGTDANGYPWSINFPLTFDLAAPVPTIVGMGNAASGGATAAPGMVLSIYGTQLASGAQVGAIAPLTTFMQNAQVVIGGYLAPLYFVSPTQLNVQVPYEVPAGIAKVQVFTAAGPAVTATVTVAPAAPGIFTNAGTLVPSSSGQPGDSLSLFITGEGQVAPALPDGATPAPTTPYTKLPAPVLPISVTVGGVNAPVLFAGIASGLVGVTQVNFTIPSGVPNGVQPVVVTVGGIASASANLTIVGSSTSQ